VLTNEGAALHEWTLAGRGLAWCSTWEVAGAIEEAPGTDIHAVFAQHRQLPSQRHVYVDSLRHAYSQPRYSRTAEKTGK
jgi:hypothetical protein